MQQSEQEYKHFDLIDDHIDAFINASGFGKEDARKIFIEYIKKLPTLLTEIEKGIANHDFQKLERTIHQLKGSSANLRITSIYQLTMEFEEAARKRKKATCERLFVELEKLFH